MCEICGSLFEIQPCFARLYCSTRCYNRARAFTPARFWERVDKRTKMECWPWTAGHDSDGYGRVFDGKRTRQAHDVGWELVTGKKLRKGRLVRHTCDNPPCCNPNHWLEGTPRDNTRDCIERGRRRIAYRDVPVPIHRRPIGERNGMHTHPESRCRGEASGNAKLTRQRVAALRRLRRTHGWSYPVLARRFGMSVSQTYRIIQGESWTWLKGA